MATARRASRPKAPETPRKQKAAPAVRRNAPPCADDPQDVLLDAQARQDSSLSRMLGTLALFSATTPSLTMDEIASRLGVPKSTGYRYIQELTKVGLLVRLDRSITLGPRIIELDRSIRDADPVIRAAIPPMRELAERTGLDTFISKLYGHSIITVHAELIDPSQSLRYGRGRPMPVFRGSSSKALTSFLPAARLRKLHQELLGDVVPAQSWEDFYDEALRIRRQGYCRTSGELNDNKTGIAAPIFGRGKLVVASVTALGNDARFTLFSDEAIADLVMQTASSISERLSADGHR